jgi:hypothetical protein
MTLSAEAQERLADIVELEPTKNSELQDRWGLESGSDVHSYLESTLKAYYYRNEDSFICATPEAKAIVAGEDPETVERVIDATDIQTEILGVLPGPDGDPQSVVSTLHDLREAGRDPDIDAVRSALQSLTEKGAAERVRTTVPTFRLAVERETLRVRE